MTKPQINRICKNCSSVFIRTHRLQHYCSIKCKLSFYTKKPSINGCWEWVGSKHQFGYGEFRWDNKLYRAHRVSFALCNGKINSGCGVFHKCDNTSCVNPTHLFSGKQKENVLDMVKKQRHGKAKLNSDKVKRIRKLLVSGVTQTKIASTFNVSQTTISCVKNGSLWSHVKQ